jgi:hypothetical protein
MIYEHDRDTEKNAILAMETDILAKINSESIKLYLLSTPTIRALDISNNDTWTL